MKAYEIAQALAEERSACLVMTNNGKKRTARLGYLNKRGRMVIFPVNIMAADCVLKNWQQEIIVSVTTPSTNPKHPMTIITASWGKRA